MGHMVTESIRLHGSVAALAAALLAGLVLSGCTSSTVPPSSPASSDSGATSSEPAPRATEEPLLATPLQAYRLTPTELTTVFYAQDVLIQQCMKGFGFDYAPRRSFADELQASLAQERWDISRIYGVSDRAWAEKYGFGVPPDNKLTADDPVRSASFDFVMSGRRPSENGELPLPRVEAESESPGEIDGRPIPPGGCGGAASVELGTGDADVSVYGFAHDLWVQGGQKLQSSSEYREVVSEWVACLAEQGYRVTDPLADQGDIQAKWDARIAAGDNGQGSPVTGEVELAVADVDCKQRVDLVKRLDDARKAIDQQAIEDNQLALNEDRKRLDEQLRKASTIVGQAGS